MPPPLRCDLFCTVIDNYGDAGVCWRLARQLANEYGWRVRLFIDAPTALAALLRTPLPPLWDEAAGRADPVSPGGTRGGKTPDDVTIDGVAIEDVAMDGVTIDGVTIAPWPAPPGSMPPGSASPATPPDNAMPANTTPYTAPRETDVAVADVVIEAFACEPPAHYLAAMARRDRAPVWINLEYLSAEEWVETCHLGHSRHPRLGLEKTFFFPGFTPRTGGLSRERDLDRQRRAFLDDATARAALWKRLDVAPPGAQTRIITLFAYENPALDTLLAQWSDGDEDILLLVPEGRVSSAVARFFGRPTFAAGARAERGRLRAQALPFVDQITYDRLLWQADLNFVRGEDSFVRAQWAERPFVWHIYPQRDGAHLDKLDAALTAYTRDLPAATAQVVRRFWHAWNAAPCADPASSAASVPGLDWRAWREADAALRAHARPWVDTLRRAGTLAANLAEFVESRLK